VSDALDVFPGRIERDEWVPQARDQYQDKYGLKLA
jgi:predicted flap endonuclease-1-like 5' DNA nuclease